MAVLRLFAGIVCGLTLLTLAFAYQQCKDNDNNAPCFADNSDILNGLGSLLLDDDHTFDASVSASGSVSFAIVKAKGRSTLARDRPFVSDFEDPDRSPDHKRLFPWICSSLASFLVLPGRLLSNVRRKSFSGLSASSRCLDST